MNIFIMIVVILLLFIFQIVTNDVNNIIMSIYLPEINIIINRSRIYICPCLLILHLYILQSVWIYIAPLSACVRLRKSLHFISIEQLYSFTDSFLCPEENRKSQITKSLHFHVCLNSAICFRLSRSIFYFGFLDVIQSPKAVISRIFGGRNNYIHVNTTWI